MSFGKWLKNRIKNVFMRELYMYKYLERYDINIEKVNRRFDENNPRCYDVDRRKYCTLVAETKKYRFYRYLDNRDGCCGYILRQNKKKPRRIVFFGEDKGPVCVYKKHLITTYTNVHDTRVWVEAKHAKTGRRYKYCFPCDAYEIPADKEGEPFACWDEPTSLHVENDRLLIGVCRCRREIRKRSTPIGEDVDYTIVCNYDEEYSFSFSLCFPLWYLEEEKGDAKAALAACDFSDMKPILA